ncbi:protein NARROW LEAF 1-like isoform X1 [Populus nigra]|uniref:protein NARROW LEAF 1-like isoform X1 n=1 Tax=Populus nigra TaxID=3691 RepID=UPI002B278728|nr:protein NARROW LEAF 1-like isoform X1 [Populus nigra]XP_061956755.1 protein NARROW LEAF 1-like isoform X1 [Populus nigra]XP_061956756.1 protein NARROW LEAF 1-like isoform X1 [Populus nigra]XP_061956757.1 protein NARROW LEAF 1-like isoform X1 [Populus nigra]XP_061956758.1 protein NARROW LEAF 1-like isoform X1 [Populus nigra]XP_061956759.1 protein NARROW LEAF 1-like isoform X1 [Populus nigra]XP_061956760.1 protein NARROW LEAF 1-like isoform X1 [Populus nigra]
MERNRLGLRIHHSGSSQSEESALDLERNYCNHLPWSSLSPLQPFTSGGQHSESNAAYFSWPTLSRLNDAAEDRANYFGNLQKGVLPETLGRLPEGQQATTLLELMTIRAFHSKILRRFSLGTAIGFRIRGGILTVIPAILVFVARKVHRQWLSHVQCLPTALEGPGGVWCDVDVVEFSYYGAPAATPKEQLYTDLVDGLRGSDPCIGSGSQVANQETYGTLGAIVKSRTGNRQVGFLTNRHVAVDLDYPNQKMFHPLPPSLGPGVYLGAVERATSFITDDLWYGIFAGTNPETFVRADGAFIPFAGDFNMNNVTTTVKGVGEVGDVHVIDLQAPINSLIGRQVVKVGRSSGLTTGTIMAYALEYNDEKGICFFTDFLVVGENQQTFDLEGDSGSLILLNDQDCEKPRPVGIIWGGTANRGRLKLKVGLPPENWTSGVDLGRLLDLLELDLITTNDGLQAAVQDQRNASAPAIDSTVGESSPLDRVPSKEKIEENFEPINLNIQQGVVKGESQQGQSPLFIGPEFHREDGAEAAPNVEHQFIPSFSGRSLMHDNKPQETPELKNLSALRSDSDEEICFSLQLGKPEPKRRKQLD